MRLACFLIGLTIFAIPNFGPSETSAERYIHDSEAQWAEATATGDTSVMERILADDFIGVDPFDGSLYDKSQAMTLNKEHHTEFISNHLDQVKIRFFGKTAVAQGSESWERNVEPRRGRFVWTDTWVLRDGKWQIVAAKDLIAPPLPAKNPG
jgi:hypothetical protein